jgi:uncharacterized protein
VKERTAEESKAIHLRVRNLPDGMHPVDIERSTDVLDVPLFHGDLSIHGTIDKQADRLLLDLKLKADAHFECTRCLEPFERAITSDLHIEFNPPSLGTADDGEYIHVYEPAIKPYVDITDDVRDALVLAVPMRTLCREDCKGLCPHCGKDLNTEKCICPPEENEGRWSALNDLQERLRAEESKVSHE